MHRRLWRVLLPLITDLQQAGWSISYEPGSPNAVASAAGSGRGSVWTCRPAAGDGNIETRYGIDGLVDMWERQCAGPRSG